MKPNDPSPFARAIRLSRVPVAVLFAALAGIAAAQAPPPPAKPVIELRLPPDIVYDRVVRADSAVVFSHATHVDFEDNRCTGCHSKLYKLLTPSRRASHHEMDAGGSCGACHDGKHAFDVRASESCGSCHTGRKPQRNVTASVGGDGAPASFKGPKAFAFTRGKDSPGVVTFKHATHLGHDMTCKSCHPKPFAMRGTAPLPNGAMHEGASCGMCHNGKQSFGTEDDSKCEKCHVEGGAK